MTIHHYPLHALARKPGRFCLEDTMPHSYMSGLIGLDVKRRKRTRVRRNCYRYGSMKGFIIAVAVALILDLFLLAGAR